eukprot:711767-Rhodomonas_salina.1
MAHTWFSRLRRTTSSVSSELCGSSSDIRSRSPARPFDASRSCSRRDATSSRSDAIRVSDS